jgi:4-hydroxybenzoate polyprenyltransferase
MRAYLNERFPLLSNVVLILSFYSSSQFVAQALSRRGEPMQYDIGSLLGCVTLLAFFLHMRIFDDHKDYAADCRFFPDRVLQRGVVTLSELKITCLIAIVIEFLLAAVCGVAAVTSLLVAFGFSLLMLKEFFLRDWLKRRFLLYASVHMLVMPLLAMVVWSFSTNQFFWQIPLWYWLYSFVSFFLGFNWEISRKIRVPDEEIDGVDSYTRLFGTYGAAYLVLLMRVIDTVLIAWIALHLGLDAWFYVWLLLLFAICLIGFLQYRFHTSVKTSHQMETYAGLYIVLFDLSLAIALVSKFGIRFSGVL